jgi:hypothetical protein
VCQKCVTIRVTVTVKIPLSFDDLQLVENAFTIFGTEDDLKFLKETIKIYKGEAKDEIEKAIRKLKSSLKKNKF